MTKISAEFGSHIFLHFFFIMTSEPKPSEFNRAILGEAKCYEALLAKW